MTNKSCHQRKEKDGGSAQDCEILVHLKCESVTQKKLSEKTENGVSAEDYKIL